MKFIDLLEKKLLELAAIIEPNEGPGASYKGTLEQRLRYAWRVVQGYPLAYRLRAESLFFQSDEGLTVAQCEDAPQPIQYVVNYTDNSWGGWNQNSWKTL